MNNPNPNSNNLGSHGYGIGKSFNFGNNNHNSSNIYNSKSKKREQLKLVEIIQQRIPNCLDPLRHNYELIAFYKEQCISGKL